MTLIGNLPEVSFSALDPAEVERQLINIYEATTGKTLFPGQPERLFLNAMLLIICQQNVMIDLAAKQNLLAYATGGHLDHLGALLDTARQEPATATTTIRFGLAAPLEWDVLIPQGTRVSTGGGKVTFAVNETTTIPKGATQVDALATCEDAGAAGNGLVPGQVNKLVDPIGYITSAANITTTSGGSDREDDEAYRARIQLAPEHFSVAGPEGAYRYFTLSAHPEIVDCCVYSPVPGTVDVRPILTGGRLPSEEILQLVRDKLSADDVRPLTDTVIVAAPEVVEYEVHGGWYLCADDKALAETIKGKVAAALASYTEWQCTKPGRDINPTKLVSLVEQAGARRVTLNSFNFQKLEGWQIAREAVREFEFLGVEVE